MTRDLDETHRPELRSWVGSANGSDTEFPPQNLPLGCFRHAGKEVRPGVAIGDRILDLSSAARLGLLEAGLCNAVNACVDEGALNTLLAQGPETLRALRVAASTLLREDTTAGRSARARADELLVPMSAAELLVPMRVGDYTDFYASVHHATNVGSMFRPDNPLLPNYKWVPIGYHGRASSIVPSGHVVHRPVGQIRDDPATPPIVGPTRRLDYELEVGAVIGEGNPLGTPIPIGSARSHIAGLCLVNDWSARDIQSWEYQPLGPFLAKSFATTVSPWIVTLDALAPFHAPAARREPGDPEPLPYLSDVDDRERGAFSIDLAVWLSSARMRAERREPMRVSSASFSSSMYWTLAQLVTHHTSNGCNLRPGDLLASGTVSGSSVESRGCLLERTWRGTEPLVLPTGESRRFLEDGDEILMRGRCERPGFRAIGFGECRGVVSAG